MKLGLQMSGRDAGVVLSMRVEGGYGFMIPHERFVMHSVCSLLRSCWKLVALEPSNSLSECICYRLNGLVKEFMYIPIREC